MPLATPGAEAFSLEEEERKARKEAEESFSDEEDYCQDGGYPEETRTAVAEDSYRGDAGGGSWSNDNVSG